VVTKAGLTVVLNKTEQTFTDLSPEDRSSSWGL